MKYTLIIFLVIFCFFQSNAQTCSGTTNLSASSGSFSDGSGANNYSHNLDCRWRIQVAGAGAIRLNFSSFDTEAYFDSVIIYNGTTTSDPILAGFTGSNIPPSVTSQGNAMLVQFITDPSISRAGWDANYISLPPLCGNYTIGGTSPDYATISEAIEDLNLRGISCAVNFNIRLGTYNEQNSIGDIRGISTSNKVTFQAENGDSTSVIIQKPNFNGPNYTLQFNQASFVVFQNLTLKNDFGRVIDIRNASHDLEFKNNHLENLVSIAFTDIHAIVYSPGDQDNNIEISNNRLLNGSMGIYLAGDLSNQETGTIIQNNVFENQFRAAIELVHHQNPQILKNKINENSSNHRGSFGILLTQCQGNSGSKGLIANNFVHCAGGHRVSGIKTENCHFQNVYFNSVHISNTNSSSIGMDYSGTSGSNVEIKNSSFYNSGGGLAIAATPTTTGSFDYNNLETNGNRLGNWGGNISSNLSGWQSNSSGDANSISFNPMYLSNSDLHINTSALNGAGNPLPQVTDDIDGESRNASMPDIGADEYLNLVLTVNCPNNVNVSNDSGRCDAFVSGLIANVQNASGNEIVRNSFNNTALADDTYPVGLTNVSYTVLDGPNAANCNFTVQVNDTEFPQINCPSDINSNMNPGQCFATINYTPPNGTDNCPGANTVLTSGLGSGGNFPLGINTETYEVTDASGNKSNCSFKITVSDNENPTINCPSNINQNTDAGQCNALINYSAPIGMDNCTGANTVLTSGIGSGNTFPVGTSIEMYRVTDASGNIANCSFSITVIDNENPTINCPANIQKNTDLGQCLALVNYAAPSGMDNCPGSNTNLTAGLASGSNFPVGNTLVTFTVTDASGNQNNCSFNVQINDNETPTINCPGNVGQLNDSGICGATINYNATSSDNCPGENISLVSGIGSGNLFPIGTTIENLLVTDASGNTANCSFNVTIFDVEDPTINCPANINISTDPGSCDAVVNYSSPIGMDNCPGVNTLQTAGLGSGATFPLGTTIETYQATDATGNVKNCSFNVIVSDNENPTINCPANINVNNDPGLCSAIVNYTSPNGTDNCPGAMSNLTTGLGSGNAFPVGINVENYRVIDAAGNINFCSFNIVVNDIENPTINCPANINANNDPGQMSAVVTYNSPTVSDNCTITNAPVLLSGIGSGGVFPVGTSIEQYSIIDQSGNVSTCDFSITVSIGNALSINCPSSLNLNNNAGICSAIVTGLAATVLNGTGSQTLTNDFNNTNLADGTYPVGMTQVIYTVTDGAFSETCGFNVTVSDNENPNITCPVNISANNTGNQCGAIVNYFIPQGMDNCPASNITLLNGLGIGAVFPVGNTLEQYQIMDASGNVALCAFVVSVFDISIPTINCPADILANTNSGLCNSFLTYNLPTGNDNCPNPNIALFSGLGSGNNFPLGDSFETYQITDASGNTANCTFKITVLDNQTPSINCPSNINIGTNAGNCNAFVNYAIPVGADNCPNPNVALNAGIGSGNVFPVGTTLEIYTVSDNAGNQASCSFTVTVSDNENPTINCPNNILVNSSPSTCDALVNYTAPTGNDNCPGSTTQRTTGLGSNNNFPVGTSIETYLVTDAVGNTANCNFSITVLDQTNPIINCPANIVTNNDPGMNSAIVTYNSPMISDNCPNTNSPIFTGIGSGGTFPLGTSIEQFIITDASGNTASCSFSVEVILGNVLSISCPSNLIVSNDLGQCTAMVSGLVANVLNGSGSQMLSNSFNNSPLADDVYPVGNTQVIYTVTDGAFTASCNFSVQVNDNELPTITCPNNILINASMGQCNRVINYTAPIGMDNCPASQTSLNGGLGTGNAFPVGMTVESYEVIDNAGNRANCSFTIEVLDNENPSINCPSNIVVNNDPGKMSAIVTYNTPATSDNCPNSNSPVFTGIGSGGNFPVGTSLETYLITDNAGNTSSCDFSITVLFSNVLAINCPSNVNVSNAPGRCNATVSGLNANILNGSGSQIVTNDFNNTSSANDIYPVASTQVIYTVVDGAFTASCSFMVTINDTEAPDISCPQSITTSNDAGQMTAMVNYQSPSISENCPGPNISLISGLTSGSAFPIGNTLVAFRITDAANNVDVCNFTVTVIDTMIPQIIPNLTTNPLFIPSLLMAGSSFSFITSITNNGLDASTNCLMGIYLSTDTNITTSDYFIGSRMISPLSIGASLNITFGADVDTMVGIPTGNYYMGYLIDYQGIINELDENDNSFAWSSLSQQITVSVRNIIISGKAKSEINDDIRTTTFDLTSISGNQSLVTGLDGNYSFRVPENSTLTIHPSKSNDSLIVNGIDVIDAALIEDHIRTTTPLASPYKIIAADVTGDNSVSVLDVNWIRRVILGRSSAFPGNRLWEFVDASYVFPNPMNPFGFPGSRTYTNVLNSQINQDYIGVKLGDIDNSWNPAIARTSSQNVYFKAGNKTIAPNSIVKIPIRVENFNEVKAYQFTIKWDETVLEFIEVKNKNLQGFFGEQATQNGKLTTLWTNAQNLQTLSDGSIIFEIEFKAIGKSGSQSLIEINSEITPAKIYDLDLKQMNLISQTGIVEISNLTAINEIEKADFQLKNQPNPFSENTIFEFEIPTNTKAKLLILNALGQEIKSFEQNFASGKQQIIWNGIDISPGIYFAQLWIDGKSQTIRVVRY